MLAMVSKFDTIFPVNETVAETDECKGSFPDSERCNYDCTFIEMNSTYYSKEFHPFVDKKDNTFILDELDFSISARVDPETKELCLKHGIYNPACYRPYEVASLFIGFEGMSYMHYFVIDRVDGSCDNQVVEDELEKIKHCI